MLDQIESTNFSMVVIAPFAPSVFQPVWFADQGLVGREAAVAATKDGSGFVLFEEAAKFTLGIFDITVQKDRMQVLTTREDGVQPMVDLFVATMSLVEPLKATALGFNFAVHFRTGSERGWHKAGDLLAGKDFWNAAWPKHVGLLNLQLALSRIDDHPGQVNVHVQPSGLTQFGVFVNINDHFDFKDGKSGPEIASFASAEWQKSAYRSTALIEKVVKESLRE